MTRRLRILGIGWGLVLAACGSASRQGPAPAPTVPPTPPPATAPAPTIALGPPTAIPTTLVPMLWQDLGLSGQLVFVESAQRVMDLDLERGALRTLFEAPFGGWVTAATPSPDGKWIAIAYAEPPPAGGVAAYTGIYQFPSDGSSPPAPLILPPGPEQAFFAPAYRPDGASLYLVHLERTPDDPVQAFRMTIVLFHLEDGQVEPLATDAFWPRISPDGQHLAYVTIDPVDLSNQLVLAGPDASDPRPALEPGLLPYVDSPVFSNDSAWLYFSAVGMGWSSASNLLDLLLGVVPAEAHNLPSDWWRVPVAGGAPQRLTEIGQSGLFGAVSPDGRHFAFLSSSGLYAMGTDGSEVTALLNTWGSGSLDWIP